MSTYNTYADSCLDFRQARKTLGRTLPVAWT